jgi:hypothetical protein
MKFYNSYAPGYGTFNIQDCGVLYGLVRMR